MSDRLLIAEAYLDGFETKYKNFKLVEDNVIKRRFSPSEDSKICKAIKEYNIRPKGGLTSKRTTIDNDLFVNYIDNHLIPKIVKKRKKQYKPNKKMLAFIAAASVVAILALGTKANEVSATENDTKITTETTTEEDNNITDEMIPVTTEENLTVTPEQEIMTESTTEEAPMINSTMVNDNFEDIFQFSASNNTGLNNDNNRIVEERYGAYLDQICPVFGMDRTLARKILCQENPINSSSNPYAHGPAQTEYIHANEELTCYNQQTKQNETIIVDLNRIDTDMEYAMKVYVMMYMRQFNYINEHYGYKLSDAELIDISTLSYNFGQTIVTDGLYNSDTYEDAIKYIYTHKKGGDDSYREHVYSYIDDGTEVTIISSDGVAHSAIFDNTNITDYQADSKETKAMAR